MTLQKQPSTRRQSTTAGFGEDGSNAPGSFRQNPNDPSTPSNYTLKPSCEAKLTGGRGCCHRRETLAPVEDELLANHLTLALIY